MRGREGDLTSNEQKGVWANLNSIVLEAVDR